MNRTFRLFLLAIFTACVFNVLGSFNRAQAMTPAELNQLSADQRELVRKAYCGGGICQAAQIDEVAVKVTNPNAAQVAKLDAAVVTLDSSIKSLKGGETNDAADQLVTKRDELKAKADALRTPKVELLDPAAVSAAATAAAAPPPPPSAPPSVAAAPGSAPAPGSVAPKPPALSDYFSDQKMCKVDADCGTGACIEGVCFDSFAKKQSRAGWVRDAKVLVASKLNSVSAGTYDGGRQLCVLHPLQPNCGAGVKCKTGEVPLVRGTSNGLETSLQRLLDLNRVAYSCDKNPDGTCKDPRWGMREATHTADYGEIRCLPASSLPAQPVANVQPTLGNTRGGNPLLGDGRPGDGHNGGGGGDGHKGSGGDSNVDMFLTVGILGGYQSGGSDRFYNYGFVDLGLSPTWYVGDWAIRGLIGLGRGGNDYFSKLYHGTAGLFGGYRVHPRIDLGLGLVGSGLWGYSDYQHKGTYLEQFHISGSAYSGFLLVPGWLELDIYGGLGRTGNQALPSETNTGFELGGMLGIPFGRGN